MLIGNLNVYGVIYKITNNINGKIYIGQTTNGINRRYCYSGEGIERIFKYHKSNKNRDRFYNNHLYNTFMKHGLNNFDLIYPLDVAFSPTELDIKECMYIAKFKSNDRAYGYNKTSGAKRGVLSEESLLKLSASSKKVWKNNYEKMFNSRARGENHPFYNKHHSEQTKIKIANTLKGRYLSSKNPTSKKVICLDTLKVYDCIRDIERELNIQNQNISKCCKGKRHTAGKKRFMYFEDYNYCIENSIDFDLYKKEKYRK